MTVGAIVGANKYGAHTYEAREHEAKKYINCRDASHSVPVRRKGLLRLLHVVAEARHMHGPMPPYYYVRSYILCNTSILDAGTQRATWHLYCTLAWQCC